MRIADIKVGRVYHMRGRYGGDVRVDSIEGTIIYASSLYVDERQYDEETGDYVGAIPFDQLAVSAGSNSRHTPGQFQHEVGTVYEYLEERKSVIQERRRSETTRTIHTEYIEEAAARLNLDGIPCSVRCVLGGGDRLTFDHEDVSALLARLGIDMETSD